MYRLVFGTDTRLLKDGHRKYVYYTEGPPYRGPPSGLVGLLMSYVEKLLAYPSINSCVLEDAVGVSRTSSCNL